jgi:hypothetical protein
LDLDPEVLMGGLCTLADQRADATVLHHWKKRGAELLAQRRKRTRSAQRPEAEPGSIGDGNSARPGQSGNH